MTTETTGLAAGGAVAEFSAGRPVPVAVKDIERSLEKLWRALADAGRDEAAKGDGAAAKHAPVTRACLWNLIVRTPGGAAFTEAKRLIDEISPSLPARVIVIAADEKAATAPVAASVEANWHEGGGTRQIGSEEVTLEAKGESCVDVPAIVRALILPDVPVASFWHGVTPQLRGRPLDAELVDAADRIVLPSGGDEAVLRAAVPLAADRHVAPGAAPRDVTSVAWLDGARWRQLVASLFDPPTDGDEARAVTSAEVECARGHLDAGLLLVGWLASRLDWRDATAEASGDERRYRFRRSDGTTVTARVAAVDEPHDTLHRVALTTPAGDYAVTRLDAQSVAWETPSIARRQPRRCPPSSDLWLDALAARGRDPLFKAALEALHLV